MSTLANKLAYDAIYEHKAMQKERELAILIDFLMRQKLRNVLEIGGMHGGTMWVWKQLAVGKLICVDNFTLEGRMEHAPNDGWRFVNEDSHLDDTRNKVVDILGTETVDLLFIDGDHSLDGVTKDFLLYSPLVSEGGIIVLHDTACPHDNIEAHNIIPLWNQLTRSYLHFHIFDPEGNDGNWGGIGVLLP